MPRAQPVQSDVCFMAQAYLSQAHCQPAGYLSAFGFPLRGAEPWVIIISELSIFRLEQPLQLGSGPLLPHIRDQALIL